MVHAHFVPFGGGLFTCREGGWEMKKSRSISNPTFEHLRVVQKIGSGRTKEDVGCDRMVFAINSYMYLFLMKFNSIFNKWSLDQGQKTINTISMTKISFHSCLCNACFTSKCNAWQGSASPGLTRFVDGGQTSGAWRLRERGSTGPGQVHDFSPVAVLKK